MEREYALYATEAAKTLLAIDSPTGYTEAAAAAVRTAFADLGFSAVIT